MGMANISVSFADQEKFAELSGDYNPVHLDEISARRTMFGRRIVHGVQLAILGLDHYFRHYPSLARLSYLKATFRTAVSPGEQLSVTCEDEAKDSKIINIFQGSDKALVLEFKLEPVDELATSESLDLGLPRKKSVSISTRQKYLLPLAHVNYSLMKISAHRYSHILSNPSRHGS